VVLVAVAAACSGDVAIGDLDARYREAVCKARVRCELSLDVASCLDVVGTAVTATTVSRVQSGPVDYNPHLGGQCVSRVENMPCDERDPALRLRLLGSSQAEVPYSASDPCDAMFVGAQAHGGPCAGAVECAGPPRAAFPFDTRCSNGACADSVGDGASCAIDADCQAGLYCGAQRCDPQQPLGAPCDPTGCAFPGLCQQARCVAAATFTVATGDPCVPGVFCADVRDYCAPNGACARLALPGEPCGACVGYAECTNGTCVTCPNGLCVPVGGGGW
jgi:hypothetical protein